MSAFRSFNSSCICGVMVDCGCGAGSTMRVSGSLASGKAAISSSNNAKISVRCAGVISPSASWMVLVIAVRSGLFARMDPGSESFQKFHQECAVVALSLFKEWVLVKNSLLYV